jgi:plastocyanin
LLAKAGIDSAAPFALAQDDDDDDSGRGRGRGRGRGGDDDNSGPGNAEDPEQPLGIPQTPGSAEVRIVGDDAGDFVPGELTVDVGQSVTFVNLHSDEHTATGSGFDTGIISDEGGTATVVLDTPGVFPYACLIHPEMTGVIRVRDENGVVPETQTAAQEIPADATTIVIANLAFNPAAITVPTGTTVAWTNNDSVPHTVTSADGLFASGIFDPGASFAFTFNEPGAFNYVCQLHPQMQGTVTAEGEPIAGGTQDAAPADTTAATPASDSTSAQAAAIGSSVSIVDFAFEPASIDVAGGDTVTWTNDGSVPHTVTGEFADSGVLEPGQTFSHTFAADGAFDYVCAIHPDMAGIVMVGAAAATAATPEAPAAEETRNPAGVWRLELTADDDAIVGAQQALVAFHTDGTLEADFVAVGDGPPASVLSSGYGEWVVRDGEWDFDFAALADDPDQSSAATVVFHMNGRLVANGAALEGTFEFTVLDPDRQTIGQGAGAFNGLPIFLDL